MIPLEIEYRTPRFRDLDVPRLSARQGGRRLTIEPRDVTIYPRGHDGHMRVYVEGRSVIQSTGMPGQQNRGISFGTPSGREYDDTVPIEDAPAWLRELIERVVASEGRRGSEGDR